MADDYQFDDLDSALDAKEVSETKTEESSATTTDPVSEPVAEPAADPVASTASAGSGGNTGGGNGYAAELFSKQIKAKFRTFFIDLKESSNGKFIKISEKSHGRKSTIMMDAEDVPVFIEALKEVSDHL